MSALSAPRLFPDHRVWRCRKGVAVSGVQLTSPACVLQTARSVRALLEVSARPCARSAQVVTAPRGVWSWRGRWERRAWSRSGRGGGGGGWKGRRRGTRQKRKGEAEAFETSKKRGKKRGKGSKPPPKWRGRPPGSSSGVPSLHWHRYGPASYPPASSEAPSRGCPGPREAPGVPFFCLPLPSSFMP